MPLDVDSTFASSSIRNNQNIFFEEKLYLIDYRILRLMAGILFQVERDSNAPNLAGNIPGKYSWVTELKFNDKFEKKTHKHFFFEKFLHFFKYGKFEKPEVLLLDQTFVNFIHTSENGFLITHLTEFIQSNNKELKENFYYLSLIAKRQDTSQFVSLIEKMYLKLSSHPTQHFPLQMIIDSAQYFSHKTLETLYLKLKQSQVSEELTYKLIEGYTKQYFNIDELLFEIENQELKFILIGCIDDVDQRIQWIETFKEYPKRILIMPFDQFIALKVIFPLFEQSRFFDAEEWIIHIQNKVLFKGLFDKYEKNGAILHAKKWATRPENQKIFEELFPDLVTKSLEKIHSEYSLEKIALEEKSKLINISPKLKAQQIVGDFLSDLLKANHCSCLRFAVDQLDQQNLKINDEIILLMIPFYVKRRVECLFEQIESVYEKLVSRFYRKLKFFLHYNFQFDASFLDGIKTQLKEELFWQFANDPLDFYEERGLNYDSIKNAIEHIFDLKNFTKLQDEVFSDKYSIESKCVVDFICEYMQPFVYRQVPKVHDLSNWIPITQKLEEKLISLGFASRLNNELLDFVLSTYICKSIEALLLPIQLHFLAAGQADSKNELSYPYIDNYLEKETHIALNYLKAALEDALRRDLRDKEKIFIVSLETFVKVGVDSQMRKNKFLKNFSIPHNWFFKENSAM